MLQIASKSHSGLDMHSDFAKPHKGFRLRNCMLQSMTSAATQAQVSLSNRELV